MMAPNHPGGSMRVSDLMTADVFTLSSRSLLIDAEEVMGLRRCRHLPVVDQGRMVGLITHRDLLRASLSQKKGHVEQAIAKARINVADVMHTDVATVHPDTLAVDAADALVQHKYGCLPVVGDDGQLVGIVTEADFVRLAAILLGLASEDGALMAKVEARL